MANVKTFRVGFTRRPIPKRGTLNTDKFNSMVSEISADLKAIADRWNNYAQPILNSLPNGSSETRWDLPDTINATIHGLDGSQIFVDNDATASTDNGRYWYADAVWARPKTIKEAIDAVQSNLDTFQEDVSDQISSVSAGLTDDQWARLGIWVRDGGSTSSAVSSVDGIARANQARLENIIDDVYESGDPPGTRLSYTVEEMLDAVAALHGGTDWSDDPSTWSHGSITIGAQSSVPNSASYTTANRSFTPINDLEDDLNRIRYEIGMTRRGAGNYWENSTTFPYNSTEINLYDHVNAAGNGTQDSSNPHGLARQDIDGLDTELGYMRAFTGKTSLGSETPTYSSTVNISNGDTLETAIGKLDAAVDNKATYDSMDFSSHPGGTTPIVWNHGNSNDYPLIQVIDTDAGDYLAAHADEVHSSETALGLTPSTAFVQVEYASGTVYIYTSVANGKIVGIF